MKKHRVALRINGVGHSHETIETELNVRATATYLKGTPKGGREGGPPYKQDVWLLKSPIADEADLKDHLRFFAELLKEHEEFISSLKTAGADLNIMCATLTNSPVVAFVFPPAITNILSKLGVSIAVIVTNSAVASMPEETQPRTGGEHDATAT